MKCKDFQECACEIVDKRLSEERTKELLQHADICPHCKYELEALQTAKDVVHEKIHRKSVPADLYYTIANNLGKETGRSWFQQLFGFKLNPALAVVALAIVLVGSYSIFFPAATVSDDSNIITQSLANYQAVIGGSIKPQLVSNNDEVKSFLEKGADFAVHVPKVKKCNSCSGALSKFKGLTLAHVMYEVDGQIVYIYQADMSEVMKDGALSLPDDARKELEMTNWYIKDCDSSKTVILWKYENTLCAAVSSINKEKLIALLTEKESQ